MRYKILVLICVSLIMIFTAACQSSPTTQAPATTTTAAPKPTTVAPTSAAPSTTAAPATSPAAKPKPVTLKFINFMPANVTKAKLYFQLWETIQQRSNGELIIDNLGGPEVIPLNDQTPAVQKGIVDVADVFSASYEGLVKLGSVQFMSTVLPAEERKIGFLDLVAKLHADAGLFLLGRSSVLLNDGFVIYSTKPIKTLADLNGKKIGQPFSVNRWITSFGGTALSLRDQDAYTALERGVADGVFECPDEFYPDGWYEVAKWGLDNAFLNSNSNTIINMNSWNKLPKNLQDLILKTQIEYETKWFDMRVAQVAQDRASLIKAGVQYTKFSADEEKTFYKTINDFWWGEVMKLTGAENGAKFKAMLYKG